MFSIKHEKKSIKVSIIIIAAIFFILQLIAIIKYNNYFLLGSLEKMDNDDVKYIRSAWTLLEKGMFTYHYTDQPTVFIMPGHVFLIAGIMKIFGKGDMGLTAFRIFQALIQTGSLYLIFLIGRRVFNSYAGIIACLIDALYIPEIASPGIILTEVEFKFLLLLLIYVSIYALETRKTKYYIWGGVVLGLGCLVRPTMATFPIVILILWFVYRYSFKECLKYTFVVLLMFVLAMSPWWVRNYLTFNRFIPLTLSSGNPFLQGTYIDYDQTRDYLGYEPAVDVIKNNEIEMETGKERLRTYFPENPGEYIKWYTIGKTYHFWRMPYYWRDIFKIDLIMAYRYHLITVFIGITGFLLSLRDKRKSSYILFLTILYFNLIHLPFFTMGRYAYPIIPLVIMYSGYYFYSVFTGWKFKRYAAVSGEIETN